MLLRTNWVLIALLVACSGKSTGSQPGDAAPAARPFDAAPIAATPVDAGPPPLVRVAIDKVALRDKAKSRFGQSSVTRPKKGAQLVLVETELTFSRCVDRPGDDSWKKKRKKGQDPGPEPRLVRIANIAAVLRFPGIDPILAIGAGSSEAELSVSEYTDTAFPCPNPDQGLPAMKYVFLFSIPADLDPNIATLVFRGVDVPLIPAAP